jgi:mono/diheme cytochrome c family protein
MRKHRSILICRRATVFVAAIATTALSSRADSPRSSIDFTRDVRPILANNCFHCHGNDDGHRTADLRLDLWQKTSEAAGAESVVTPGKPDESELISRITSDDPDEHMPPADSGKSLTPEQIEILKSWVAQGAEYKPHWAFVAPAKPAIPQLRDASWVQNPIDSFVLADLERDGLRPSPPADSATLVRRLSLDLIGLPPTLDEVAAFPAAAGRDVYEHQVDRLLDSPHFGERWARVWLDAARYADSDGFEKDKPRQVWMYRDWVIDALNRDMPYDQFVVDQIAGDLLPHPTQDDLVATGFLRNSMVNQEGGIDPEQFRMEAMFDRMDAIGKAVLGLTVQCAQCHSHKYDPLSQTEYYRMFAFLNNCHEAQITVYTPEEQDQWEATNQVIRRIEVQLRKDNPKWRERLDVWEAAAGVGQPEWAVVRPKLDTSGGQKHYLLEDGSVLAAGYAPSQHSTEFTVESTLPRITAVRLELLNDPSLPHGGPGRSVDGLCALTEFKATAAPLDEPDKKSELKFNEATADVNPPERELAKTFDDRKGTRRVTGPIQFAIDGDELTAWGLDIGPGRSNLPRNAVFVFEAPIQNEGGTRLTFKLVQKHGDTIDDDTQNNNLGRFRFAVTSAVSPHADPVPKTIREILKTPAADRSPEQVDALFSYWRTTVPEWREANDRIEALWQSHPRGTSQLVLQERSEPRQTHRLQRGDFLKPAEAVSPGVPAFLHPLDDPAPNRLSFACWLADRRSPTTARSIVNRVWQAYFGTGLVATAEDLGTQGEPPTHPQLLDWLAVDFMDHGWSLKHLHRLIVSSATYQQSSVAPPDLVARDPQNRLLARGPRFRVDAEIVRDIALAASGLLNDKIGGPSVCPPAPAFLFQRPVSFAPKVWNLDSESDKYRRALYTFRYRSVPYPALQTFDAPAGDLACARRTRSNTPLQALTTLNEPLFFECARALAVKIVTQGGASDNERLTFAVHRCLDRDPRENELTTLQQFLDRQRERFRQDPAGAATLVTGADLPSTKPSDDTSSADLAAWTALARVVLNLDETITKE